MADREIAPSSESSSTFFVAPPAALAHPAAVPSATTASEGDALTPMLDTKGATTRNIHLCMATGVEDTKYSILWMVAIIAFSAISAALGYGVNGAADGLWAPLLSHGIQWLVCLTHAFPFQTEMYYDLTGSITYVLLTLFTLGRTVAILAADPSSSAVVHPRQIIASSLVLVWAVRLGSFLFARIRRDTKDGRFDELKPYLVAFLGTWNIQGAWCFITGLSVYAVNTRPAPVQPALGWLDAIGIIVWLVGFGIEVVADHQKSVWRALPTSRGRYIDVGLWRYSRHPNYFGEWSLWLGQFLLCASAFGGGDSRGAFVGAGWLCAISPLFVYLLLNYLSGVPLLEKKADERWGGEAAYLAYKRETWVFFLLPTRRTDASRPVQFTPPTPAGQ